MARLELLSAMLLVFCPIMMLISLLTPRAAVFSGTRPGCAGCCSGRLALCRAGSSAPTRFRRGGHLPGSEGRSEVPAAQESAR